MPPSDDETWDAADWQPQQWDGEKWVDAAPHSSPAPPAGDDLDEAWDYEEVEAADPGARRLVVGAGATLSAFFLIAAIVVALTGGSDAPVADVVAGTSTTKGTTGTTAAPRPNSPLTGLPGDPAKAKRPAVVVKVDNMDEKARPQSGINQADVVFEEKVEGPNSRFLAIFHSGDADKVGPVRSARTSDLAILDTLNTPLFAFSGANTTFRPLILAANIVDLGADASPEPYRRDDARQAPYNLYTSTAALWDLDTKKDHPPKQLFQYRKLDEGPRNGVPKAGVTYQWGGGKNSVEFRWDAAKRSWTRFQNDTAHVDAAGEQIAVANVIVIYVDYVDTGVKDSTGAAVPKAKFEGVGDALVFTDGQLVQGKWDKPSDDDLAVIADSSGTVIALTPGRTWVALVPKGSANVVNRTDTPAKPAPTGAR